jgi:hypothetical protein
MNASPTRPAATFVAATSLTFLKPGLKKTLWPWVAYLARSDGTANQVTVTSLIGSVVVGGLLCVFAAESGRRRRTRRRGAEKRPPGGMDR